MLGVGPGKTTRLVETESPVDSILAERGARNLNVNILRYFSNPAILDDKAKAFLQRGMTLAMESAVQSAEPSTAPPRLLMSGYSRSSRVAARWAKWRWLWIEVSEAKHSDFDAQPRLLWAFR